MDRGRVLREAALVVAVAAFQLLGTHAAAEHQHAARGLDAGSTLLLLVGPLALPLRRWLPWATVGAAVLAAVAYFSIGYPGGPVFASVVVALVALQRDRVRQMRVARRQQEERRRGEERLRIARELHDVLAHSTAVVSVQSGVALHLLDTHPEQVRPALEAIREASAQSLRELRAALDVLRSDAPGADPSGTDPGSAGNRAPQPGLDRLDDLLTSSAAAGLDVRASVEGERRALDPAVDLAGYRVIQEALTNAARHAGSREVRVRVRYEPNGLVLQVDSTGRTATRSPGGGAGLIGMRERVTALGGTVQAGPTAGGFQVRAEVPYEAGS
ncbi:MAG TPA: histidine kinase [Mycobacteriales bacterium]|jgi:signal transduction histidine kinase|nr:histidine kinase [Mycobacteriales bacterium]